MSQATISQRPYINSNLFSSHYLDERLKHRDEWDCNKEARKVMHELQDLYQHEQSLVKGYNEDALVDNWIDEVLEVLGFGTQPEVTLPEGGGYIDELLFETPETRRNAAEVYLDTEDTTDLYERGVGIVEAKQWNADFTARFSDQRPYRNASHQIKHYLEKTTSGIQWGILTNGRKWRLYGTYEYETQTYYEVDLPELLENDNLEAFKYFYLFFRPDAYYEFGGSTFHDEVFSESETASQELGESLQDNVFTALRVLGRGFIETNSSLDIDPNDDEALDELKQQSLVFLYRLMFVLYAESRGLIHPKSQSNQDEYNQNFSLDELRLEIHDTIGEADSGFEDQFSNYSTTMWNRMEDLFTLIDSGKQKLGIPPYNGGLFDNKEHEFLTKHEVSNKYLAEVIYRLTTTQNDEGRFVLADYADLDTRHLGSVYEGLLEHQFRIAPEQYAAVSEDGGQVWKPADEVSVADAVETVPKGGLYVVNDEGERKATGAYYTPDYVVDYIVKQTVGPLVDEIQDELIDQGFEPGTQEYIGPFFKRVTDLRILDPAMGSGHFLTKATGYLSERVMAEVREAESDFGVSFNEQHVRREVAKECIYGVDINGMAVELAKLSMWLETLAADRPLAFLDHHFKQGNSLLGSDIENIEELESDVSDSDGQYSLAEFGATREGTIERLMNIYSEFLAIENETIEDVQKMKNKYDEIKQDRLRQQLVSIANVHTAESFDLNVPSGAYERMARALEDNQEWNKITQTDWFNKAQSMSNARDFFHWKLAFQEVFHNKGNNAGFDAVIGNPPYVSNWNLTESDSKLVDALQTTYDEVAVGHWDLYIIFCERSLRLLSNGGRHSFITSNSISKEKYARKIRQKMVEEYTIDNITTFEDDQVFRGVTRLVLIYIVENAPPESSILSIATGLDGNFQEKREISQEILAKFSNYSWRTDITEGDLNIKSKVESEGVRLGHICWVNPGIVAHSASDSPLDFKKDDIIIDEFTEGAKKYASGQEVKRHHVDWNGDYIEYDKYAEHFHRSKNPALFEPSKIMFSNITDAGNQLKSCFDDSGYYTNHSVNHATKWTNKTKQFKAPADYSIHEEVERFDLIFVAGIVNSSLISYYFSEFHATKSLNNVSRMPPEAIRSLPVYDVTNERGEGLNINLPVDINKDNPVEAMKKMTKRIIDLKKDRGNINLNILDYLGDYSEGAKLPDIGLFQPTESSILNATTEDYTNLKISDVKIEHNIGNVKINVATRYKPENPEAYETDSNGYTETDFHEAFSINSLSQKEVRLIKSFVPIAIEKAKSSSSFAGFRQKARKTISPMDRLKNIILPELNDVDDDLERYMEAVERAEELDEKIEQTDKLIDEIVYELYGLTDEEIEIVEDVVSKD